MAFFIFGFLLVSYLVSRRLFGTACALGGLLLLATFPPLYGNGKSVLGEMPGMFYLAIFLFCFSKSLEPHRRITWLILAGVSAGLCASTKPFFLILLPVLIVGAVFEWKRKTLSLKEIGIAALCTCIPLAVWFVAQFHIGGESFANILSFYANPYAEQSIIAIVWKNTKLLFSDPSTLYTMLLLAAWFISVWFRTRVKERISSIEVMSFMFSLITIFAWLRTGGLFRYLFPAQAVMLLFFPYVAFSIFKGIFKKISLAQNQIFAGIAIGTLSILGFYQLAFHSWVADSYDSHKTAFWQDYFARLPSTISVFFYDTPEVAIFMHTDKYHQFLLVPAGVTTGKEQLSTLHAGTVDKVIVATNHYQPASTTMFRLYTPDQTAYKYTILKKK